MKNVLVFVMCLLALASHVLAIENDADSVENTFNFIEQVQRHFNFTENQNNILVIGDSDSDKSLLVQYVADDSSNLTSIEPVEATTEYRTDNGFDTGIENNVMTSLYRTIVPNIFIDDSKNVWYDLSASRETGNQTVEITTKFLLERIIRTAENVKIVLVLDYVCSTVELDRLLAHATELIKNVDRYNSSVSLVVNNVPSYRELGGAGEEEPLDDSVKKRVAKFLNTYRRDLQENGLNERKIQLIDALLDEAPKVSVFRPSNGSSAYNTSDEIGSGRRQLNELIHGQTSYTKIQPEDFEFTLAKAAQMTVDNMARHTTDIISKILMNKIDNHLLGAMQQKIESIKSFHDRQSIFSKAKSLFSTDEGVTVQQLTEFLISVLKFNITLMETDLNRIKQQENNVKILRMFAQTKSICPISDWMANLPQTNEYITTEYNWYSFLIHVYEFFDRSEVQENISIYNVADLSDWGQSNEPQGLLIEESNFNEFKKRFPNFTITKHSPSRLKELNEIIHITSMSSPQYECEHETMTIKGQYMRSSHIKPSECPNVLKIIVFVVGTFYVDSDLYLTGYRELKIFADEWKVLKATIFNLYGSDGEEREAQPQAELAGRAGNPGDVGKNAANFFGLANDIVNGDALRVCSFGGRGGDGQHGIGSDDVEPVITYSTLRYQS